jgi:hypothetical protein
MTDTTHSIDPDRIQFIYKWVTNGAAMGEVTCFDDASRVPGCIALGNEFFRWDQPFEHRFGGDFVARSPGVVQRQTIRVQLGGKTIEYEWDHTRQIARCWFKDRPIVEIECPTGEILLLSYQPTGPWSDAWCRMIPTVWDTPLPYGFTSRHVERLSYLVNALVTVGCIAVFLAANSFAVMARVFEF